MIVAARRDGGSAAVELVLLTPVLVVLMLFVVYAGRSGEGMSELRHAADQGARAASLVARSRMSSVARAAVLDDLRTSGTSCVDPTVRVRQRITASAISVTVDLTCRVSTQGANLLRITPRVIRASSTEIIDRFRSDG